MTTLLVNVRDDSKVKDVVRFLNGIDFLEVSIQKDIPGDSVRRRPAPELMKTRIVGNIMDPVIPESEWEALREANS